MEKSQRESLEFVSVESKRSSFQLLMICILVVWGASYGASLIQTSFGKVAVMGFTLPTQNGQWVAADLFRPISATRKSPAPLVVVVPGFQRSKESLSNIAIELSRRGIVVISLDPYAQGLSSSSLSTRAATTEGYGLFAVVNYVHDTPNLNYIDKSRIAATGHSAGGNAAIRGASYFGRRAAKSDMPSKLHSVYVSGYVLSQTDRVLRNVRSNVGMSYALYDEGAFRNESGNGDMSTSVEALRLVNSALPDDEKITTIEMGKYYGNISNGSARVVYNERLIHPLQPYSVEATANQIQFFEDVLGTSSGLTPEDQRWYWKELLTLVSAVAALVALVPLGQLLLSLPYFSSLVNPVPPAPAKAVGTGKIIFWSVFAFSALLACCTYIPLAELSQNIFFSASNRIPTWFFPQRMNNAVMLWAIVNGVAGLIMVLIVYLFYGKRHGITQEMLGVNTSLVELSRSAILALVIFCFFFVNLFAVHYVFHVDYRFVFFGARVFQPVMFALLVMYAPLFFVFFLANSLRVNGAMRFSGEAEWKSLLRAGIANSLGLLLILLVQYVTLYWTGTVFWTESWLYVNLLFAVAPIMFFLPYFHRYFFRMTGRIYLGPMVTCLVFVMILLSNTVCYTPL